MSLPTACPLCAADARQQSVVTAHVYGGGDGQAVFRCGSCDLRYLHPGLSPEDELRFYTKEFEGFMSARSAEGAGWEQPERHIRANEQQRVRRMSHLQPLLSGPKRILEVGCSSGFMLFSLRDAGHSCVGIEPSGVFSDYVRSRNLACYASLEDLRASTAREGGFDLILHYYVMEHVGDPLGFLKEQLALLRPGGAIVFEVPHAEDALTGIYEIAAYERFIWVLSHRWYFTRRSLSHLLSLCGGEAEIRLDQRYDLSNHMVWARDGKPGGMERFTHLLGKDIEDQYRQALVRTGYADTLIGIVRR